LRVRYDPSAHICTRVSFFKTQFSPMM
jgi:hypothetical protein